MCGCHAWVNSNFEKGWHTISHEPASKQLSDFYIILLDVPVPACVVGDLHHHLLHLPAQPHQPGTLLMGGGGVILFIH